MTSRRKLFVIIASFIVVSLIIVIIAVIMRGNNQSSGNGIVEQNSYSDPSSGEVVLDPVGKTPEKFESTGVVLLGFSKLLDRGMSSGQLDDTQLYITDYANTKTIQTEKITEISLVVSSIKQYIDSATGQKRVTGDIKVNRKFTQTLELTYYSVNDVTLNVYDQTSNDLVYFAPNGE